MRLGCWYVILVYWSTTIHQTQCDRLPDRCRYALQVSYICSEHTLAYSHKPTRRTHTHMPESNLKLNTVYVCSCMCVPYTYKTERWAGINARREDRSVYGVDSFKPTTGFSLSSKLVAIVLRTDHDAIARNQKALPNREQQYIWV